jgi:hypothetical protein
VLGEPGQRARDRDLAVCAAHRWLARIGGESLQSASALEQRVVFLAGAAAVDVDEDALWSRGSEHLQQPRGDGVSATAIR